MIDDKPLTRLALSGLLFFATSAAMAESSPAEPTPPTSPMVITISYVPTPDDMATTPVTQIDAKTIEHSHAANATELLQQVPGLQVEQASGRGNVGSVYLRGADPNYTLVLIDGVAVNDPTNSRGGSFDFSTLDPADIERIEVAPGPLTAIYGSGAMAGVINIITRRGKGEPAQRLRLSVGTRGYRSASAGFSAGNADHDYSLTVAASDDGQPISGSEYRSQLFSGQFGKRIGTATELRTQLRLSDSDHRAFPDDSGGPLYAVLPDTDSRNDKQQIFGITLDYPQESDWRQRLSYNLFRDREDYHSPGVAPGVRDPAGIPPNSALSHFTRQELDWRHDLQINQRLQLILGANLSHEDGDTEGELDLGGGFLLPTKFALQRDSWALYGEGQYSLGRRLSVQVALRQDHPDGEDAQFIPRLGMLYRLADDDTTIRINWGRGFKLPSMFALGHPIVGNPALRPERAQSVDLTLGRELLNDQLTLSLALFHNRYKDQIDFQETPTPMLVNRSEVVTSGVQLQANYRPDDRIQLNGHIDYLDTDIRDSVEQLRNRPRWRAGATLSWSASSRLQLHLAARYVGEALDSSIPTGDLQLPAYTRLDMAADWRINSTASLFMALDNLLDADYQDAVGFPGPGLQARIGTQLHF